MLLREEKVIVCRIHSIGKVGHNPVGEQSLPWFTTDFALAALERQQQCIQTRRELCDIIARSVALQPVEVGHLVSVRLHVVQLMLVGAPDGVHEIIIFCHDTDGLVCILGQFTNQSAECLAFNDSIAPEFDVDMLTLACLGFLGRGRDGNGYSVKVFVKRNTGEFEQCRDNVGVRRGESDFPAWCYAGAANNEWHVDVFFDVARLAGGHSMLTNVVPIVAGIDDVGIGKDFWALFQPGDEAADQLVDRLKGLQAGAVELVTVLKLLGGKLRKVLEVVNVTGLLNC